MIDRATFGCLRLPLAITRNGFLSRLVTTGVTWRGSGVLPTWATAVRGRGCLL